MAKKKDTATPLEKMKFEEAMDELEKIVGEMEEGGLTLEESIDKFERGIKLSQICAKQLEKAELKVDKLTRAADGGIESEPFETDAGDDGPEKTDEEDGPKEGMLF